MKKILNALKWFVLHIEEIIAVIAIFVMMCAVFFNVLMRYLFRSPTAWSDELAMICLAYVTFVGGAAAYKRNLHFGIDILVDKLPVAGRMFIRRVVNFMFIFLFGITAYLGYNLFSGAVKRMNYTGWSYKIMDAALPLGFLSMTVYAIYFFIQSFRDKAAYQRRYEGNYEEEPGDAGVAAESAAMGENDKTEGGNGK